MENKNNVGVRVELNQPDDFLKIRETLERIGIQSKTSKTLYQTCHILHKRGEYSIVHFLEMFILDGKTSSISDEDYRRRNAIAKLLHQWKLCKIQNQSDVEFCSDSAEIKIVPYKDKKTWNLIQKYKLGKSK